MTLDEKNIAFQAEQHPLVSPTGYKSLEAYCLDLMHRKAYEVVAEMGQGLKVLDFGCNDGYGTRIISESAKEAVGIDVSPKAIEAAKNRYGEEDIKFYLFDGIRTSFDDGYFDLVTSLQVVEHIIDHDKYFSELIRVVAPGGTVVFTTPNAVIRLDPGMKPWSEFHVREFSPNELHEFLMRWFPKVVVQGLFANESLYKVEFNRVNRSRERARRKSRPSWKIRKALSNLVKAVHPGAGYGRKGKAIWTRDMAGDASNSNYLDESILRQYSTADFFYSGKNLDQALDLMAICYRGAKPND